MNLNDFALYSHIYINIHICLRIHVSFFMLIVDHNQHVSTFYKKKFFNK